MPRHTEADRDLAARHVREGVARTEWLSDNIEWSRKKGFATALSEQALATMMVTLDHMRDHLADIELDLDGPPSPPEGGAGLTTIGTRRRHTKI